MKKKRCEWAEKSLLDSEYHDTQWGFPLHDDNKLFEVLILETMQAGLNWGTILKKKEGIKDAFDNFNPKKIREYDAAKIELLLQDKRIIRNTLKIKSTISNADAFLNIIEEYGSFDSYIWMYVDGVAIQSKHESLSNIPKFTPLAEKITKDLKKRGFKFIGPTIIYSFMQSIGMVNDHLITCPTHELCII